VITSAYFANIEQWLRLKIYKFKTCVHTFHESIQEHPSLSFSRALTSFFFIYFGNIYFWFW